MTGRNAVPLQLVKERREYEVGLYLAGLSKSSIVKQINKMAASKQWGTISKSTLLTDINKHYEENRGLDEADFSFIDNLREAHLDRMEINIEKLAISVNESKNNKYDSNGKLIKKGKEWKAFEYQSSLESLHKMFMDMAELQNWNLGRKNALVGVERDQTNLIYQKGSIAAAKAKPEDIQALVEITNEAMEALRKGEEDNN